MKKDSFYLTLLIPGLIHNHVGKLLAKLAAGGAAAGLLQNLIPSGNSNTNNRISAATAQTSSRGTAQQQTRSQTVSQGTAQQQTRSQTMSRGTAQQQTRSQTVSRGTAQQQTRSQTVSRGTAQQTPAQTMDLGMAIHALFG
jgi:cobalamin biosynthesis Mg chelatase CobN